jgi:hypothetical protein
MVLLNGIDVGCSLLNVKTVDIETQLAWGINNARCMQGIRVRHLLRLGILKFSQCLTRSRLSYCIFGRNTSRDSSSMTSNSSRNMRSLRPRK